jgi:hypothetical protein
MEKINAAQPGSRVEGLRRSVTQIAVLHIPHSSKRVPEKERQTILLDDAGRHIESPEPGRQMQQEIHRLRC